MTFTIDRSNWTRVRFGDVVRKSKEKVNPTLGEVEYYVAGEHMETDNLHIDNKGALHNWGCSWGLNPPVSRRQRVM